jgi:hypothetical protein
LLTELELKRKFHEECILIPSGKINNTLRLMEPAN